MDPVAGIAGATTGELEVELIRRNDAPTAASVELGSIARASVGAVRSTYPFPVVWA